MRILLTNDDGIYSEGLRVLSSWAKTLGDITIAAPEREQSGKSQSIDIHNPFEIRKIDYDGAEAAYSVGSTPADCVRFAFDRLGEFDLVLSGVNRGVNVGGDIGYSGTCGAVFESYFYNTPSVAFSVFPRTFLSFEENAERIWAFFLRHGLLEKNLIWNVNIPDEVRGILITQQGGPYYRDWFRSDDGVMFHEEGHSVYTPSPATLQYDTDAVLRDNMISITPLEGRRSERDVFEALKDITE
jgi:5'-nucleotidase